MDKRTVDDRFALAEALSDYIDLTLGRQVVDPHPRALRLRQDGTRLSRVLMQALGVDSPAALSRALTLSNIPDLLTNRITALLAQDPGGGLVEHRQCCQRVELPDYRASSIGSISLGDDFAPVPDAGAFAAPEFEGDSLVTDVQVQRYVARYDVSRALMVAPDIGLMVQLQREARNAMLRVEAKQFATVLESSPMLPDGDVLFTAANSVGSGSGGQPSVTTLDYALASLRSMTTPAGSISGARGSILLVPGALEMTALTLLTAVDPTRSRFKVAVSPWLTDSKAWYVLASPSESPSLIRTVLEGDEPIFTTGRTINRDGLAVKVEHTFGFHAVSRLGIFRNAGV